MASIQDERGYNQGFQATRALEVRTNRRVNFIISQMENRSDLKILEIGCGTGEIAHLIAEKTHAQVLGLDLSEKFITFATKKYPKNNLRFVSANFTNAEFTVNEGKFNYVIGNGILHHLYYNLDESLKKISDLLVPGGKIIFLEPNIYNPYVFLIFKFPFFRKLAKLEPDEMAFSKSFIVRRLKQAGYESVNISYKDFLIPNTPTVLIDLVCYFGAIVEKIPLLNKLSQSIFISAKRN